MTNIPAFPQVLDGIVDKPGMTLRDYFAGQALQGLIARSSGIRVADADVMARGCYAYADAMLEERDK